MLNNPLGVYLYLILRNDVSWGMLSKNEREIIKEANYQHNNFRDDYASPEKYGAGRLSSGENWDSYSFDQCIRSRDIKCKLLYDTLNEYNPSSVLEVGPGAGYYSNMICNYSSVNEYHATDINNAFIDYVGGCIGRDNLDNKVKYYSYVGDASTIKYDKKFDMIVIFGAVHHIPDRGVLFNNLQYHLSDKGVVVAVDPSHYLKRIILLSYKAVRRGYLTKKYYMNRSGLSTHHMCTVGEYKKIVKNNSNLYLKKCVFNKNKLINIPPLDKYLSSQIGIVIQNK